MIDIENKLEIGKFGVVMEEIENEKLELADKTGGQNCVFPTENYYYRQKSWNLELNF